MIARDALTRVGTMVQRRRNAEGRYGRPESVQDWIDATVRELSELSIATGFHGDPEMEFGDVLINVLHLAEELGIDATKALERSAAKINGRLDYLDAHEGEGTASELWRRAKELESWKSR